MLYRSAAVIIPMLVGVSGVSCYETNGERAVLWWQSIMLHIQPTSFLLQTTYRYSIQIVVTAVTNSLVQQNKLQGELHASIFLLLDHLLHIFDVVGKQPPRESLHPAWRASESQIFQGFINIPRDAVVPVNQIDCITTVRRGRQSP